MKTLTESLRDSMNVLEAPEFGKANYTVETAKPVDFINMFNKMKHDTMAQGSQAVLGKAPNTVDIFQASGDNVVDFVDFLLDQLGGEYTMEPDNSGTSGSYAWVEYETATTDNVDNALTNAGYEVLGFDNTYSPRALIQTREPGGVIDADRISDAIWEINGGNFVEVTPMSAEEADQYL